jgi:predicted negative regulator of RcsB-dependent stress response
MKEKILNFLTTPIKVSYRERSEYTKLDKVILTPAVLFIIVFLVTWQAWEVSRPSQNLESDTALSNAMIYFEKGDFDNAELQLSMIIEDHKGTSKAISLFDSAQKHATSKTEKNYISILKAKRMILDNNKEDALEILDNITLESSAYQEMFEHTYGMALSLN